VVKISRPLFRKKEHKSEKGLKCHACGSEHVVKNGRYYAVNWLLVFLVHIFPFFTTDPERRIQRQICSDCKSPVTSREKETNSLTRGALKLLRAKLICMLRFSAGMSVRDISLILEQSFGHNCSTGYITTLCQKVAKGAKEKMNHINNCAKKHAEVVILDETFPRTKGGTAQLGVIVDEFGLIRGLKAIVDRKNDLLQLLRSVFTVNYKPGYFMSDYDKLYPSLVEKVDPKIVLLKDFVHAIRTILRDAKTAINGVNVTTSKGLTKSEQKKIRRLKQRLLRKRLYGILRKLFRGFRKENAPVGTIQIEGALNDLKELADSFPSLQHFYKKTAKFIRKYIDIWALQMELGFRKGLPTTSNGVESKNSLFKVFMKKAKCFENNTTMEEIFWAVALMENFSIKTRGKNKGSSACMRAGVDFDEFGGKDFFEAVNITEIVLGKNTKASPSKNVTEECFRISKEVA